MRACISMYMYMYTYVHTYSRTRQYSPRIYYGYAKGWKENAEGLLTCSVPTFAFPPEKYAASKNYEQYLRSIK